MRGTVPKGEGGLAMTKPVLEDFTYPNRGHLTGSYTGIEEGAKGGFIVDEKYGIDDLLDASPLDRFFYSDDLGVEG
ncbi:hypothetical protein AX14_007565 [Amanita brunnescens Koide BX004]|nr:hypothetical protein AX14_007565 [Amanita brunnescens Koide BX004]